MKLSMILIIAMMMVQYGPEVPAAESLINSGTEIALQAQRNFAGFSSFTADMEMTHKNIEGENAVYKLKIAVAREKEGHTQKLFRVTEPANLKGTALLIKTREDADSEYWFYLSARKRAKRIYPIFQTGPFLNSEWTYEDMNGHVVEKYVHHLMGSDTIDGRLCFTLEATPKNNDLSGYSRQIQWIDKQTYDVLKIEYYDHQNVLLKTLILAGYESYPGNFRHAGQMRIIRHDSGKTQQVKFSNFVVDGELEKIDFDSAQFHKGGRLAGQVIRHAPDEKIRDIASLPSQ